MSWSPEELVKQLRYPMPNWAKASANAALMRDAADMIERLTQTHWVAYRDRAQNAEAAIARVRELCDRAVFTGQHMLPETVVRGAIEGNQP